MKILKRKIADFRFTGNFILRWLFTIIQNININVERAHYDVYEVRMSFLK